MPGIVLASKVFAEKMKGCRKNVGGEPSLMVSEVPAPGVASAERILPALLLFFKEALIQSARAGSESFFVRQKHGKQRNTLCISWFSCCMDGGKDPLSSRR